MIPETDLILNADGSIYHLNLLPEDLAGTVITVGDPDRVPLVSRHFDHIEVRKGKREFITHTGRLGSKRLTVLSTGIGTDNIDIVLNELDALANVNFATRTANAQHRVLDIIRIGTSGALQADISMDSLLVSGYGLGMDALMGFYTATMDSEESALLDAINGHLGDLPLNSYLTRGDEGLAETIGKGLATGITVTMPGFYAPQGRRVRASLRHPGLLDQLSSFQAGDERITNLEMETAGIYALARVLGHRALSVNAVLANRATLQFSKYPDRIVDQAIRHVLERL